MSDNTIIAVCTECRSDQSEAYVEKNPFYQQGLRIPCQFCNGEVKLIERKNRQRVIDKADEKRGL